MHSSLRVRYDILVWLLLVVNTAGVVFVCVDLTNGWNSARPAQQVLANKEVFDAVSSLNASLGLVAAQATQAKASLALTTARHPMVATTTTSIIRASATAVYAEERATQKILWTFTIPTFMKMGWADPVVADDRTVLIPTYMATVGLPPCTANCEERARMDAEPSYLYALDTRTGALLWKAQLDGPSPARFLEENDDRVYIGTEKGYWYTIRIFDLATGALLWKTDINEEKI